MTVLDGIYVDGVFGGIGGRYEVDVVKAAVYEIIWKYGELYIMYLVQSRGHIMTEKFTFDV
jgi:hypothetical protein